MGVRRKHRRGGNGNWDCYVRRLLYYLIRGQLCPYKAELFCFGVVVFFFHPVGPRVARFGGKCFYLLSYLVDPF